MDVGFSISDILSNKHVLRCNCLVDNPSCRLTRTMEEGYDRDCHGMIISDFTVMSD